MTELQNAQYLYERIPQAVKDLIKLHRLIKNGEGDSSEADLIRDKLDEPIWKLTFDEDQQFRFLSADLYRLDTLKDLREWTIKILE